MPTERQGLREFMSRRRVIKRDYISRIEGEAGFVVELKEGIPVGVRINVWEAPRFFEAFLRGRTPQEAIDFTARICGICPVAYQITAALAFEKIFHIEVPEPIKDLRRLFYLGEWIESHSLHIFLLHGPDFFDLPDAWSSKDYLEILKKGLWFKRIGNSILNIIGGRSIHPVSVRIGGFYSLPQKRELLRLVPEIERAFEESLRVIRWTAGLSFKDIKKEHEFVSLKGVDEYPLIYGPVISSSGLEVSMEEFITIIKEFQRPYSSALFSMISNFREDIPYLVGPLSRVNINHQFLPDEIKGLIKGLGIEFPLKDINMSIIARAIEISYAFYESMRLIKGYEEPDRASVDYEPSSGKATWITEAPRGILIHSYEVDEGGIIKEARLVPPTSQNLYHMERMLQELVKDYASESRHDTLKRDCERLIRAYDPCISCSVHLVAV